MDDRVALSVRIDPELHRRVRLKAVGEGVAVEALLRGWLGAYADGVLFADGARVGPAVPAPGLGLVSTAVVADEVHRVPLKPHAADPKDKASQEHRKRESTKKSGLCPHRVPVGVFCKKCEEGT